MTPDRRDPGPQPWVGSRNA